jgi:hypothetical protein
VNVVNGQLQVDTDKGELLTDVLSSRAALQKIDIAKGAWDPGVLERGLGIFLGIIFGIVFLGVGAYYIYNMVYPSSSRAPTGASVLASLAATDPTTPDTAETPATPATPETPETPATPVTPATPATPAPKTPPPKKSVVGSAASKVSSLFTGMFSRKPIKVAPAPT